MATTQRVPDTEPRPYAPAWWLVHVTLGGVLALLAPALGLSVARAFAMPPWATYPTMALAGALMGLVLGVTQAGALHRTVLAVPRAAWALLTAVGALVSWSLGLVPHTVDALGDPLDLASRRVLLAVVAGVVVLVVVVPVLQWLLLRRVVHRAWRWIPLSLVAAVLAVGVAWLGAAWADRTGPDALGGALAVVASCAATFALVTGLGLRRLARSVRDRS